MSKTKLRPCPFCGGNSVVTGVKTRRGFCNECFVLGPARKTKGQATEAWNDRIGSDINDQIGCLYEIRCLLGDKEGKLMQSEVVDRIKLALFDIGHLEARIVLFAIHVGLRGGMSLANEMREFVNKRVTARKQRREAAKGGKK